MNDRYLRIGAMAFTVLAAIGPLVIGGEPARPAGKDVEKEGPEGKAAPAPVSDPGDLDRFLAAWAKKMEDLKTLEVRFRQEKKLRILRRPLVSRGRIVLRVADRRLRSTVFGADGKPETEILARDGRVEILYPALKRLEVYDLGAGAAPPVAFPGLGGEPAALKRDHEVRLERGGDGIDRLILVPRDPASPIRELRLGLRDFVPKELLQVDRSGDSVRLDIEEFRANAPLEAKDLELEIPPGTEEVRPMGKPRGESNH